MKAVWHWLAMSAHVPPLIAVALFTSSTAEMTFKVVILSLVIHTLAISAEAFALSRKDGVT